MASNNQSDRLTRQHKATKGAEGIFGEDAKRHDAFVRIVARKVMERLTADYPQLQFRHRPGIEKKDINAALRRMDSRLGQTLYVENSNIAPDGGIVEVKDDNGSWRIVLVAEAKHQGKDIENIRNGVLVGKNGDQDLMSAGNAIERSHKNVAEVANYMLSEAHFPYVLFLEGSNFLTRDVTVARPDGRMVTLEHNSGALNRLDRLTAANYGMPINSVLCENIFVGHKDRTIMLQAASIFTRGDGGRWSGEEMEEIMLSVAQTSLKSLGCDLFHQLTKPKTEDGHGQESHE